MWLAGIIRGKRRANASPAEELLGTLLSYNPLPPLRSSELSITSQNIQPFFTALLLLQTPPQLSPELVSRFIEYAREKLNSDPRAILRIAQLEGALNHYNGLREEVRLVEATVARSCGEQYVSTEDGTMAIIRDTFGTASHFISVYEDITINMVRLLVTLNQVLPSNRNEKSAPLARCAVRILRNWRAWRESIVSEAERIFGEKGGLTPLVRCFNSTQRLSDNSSLAA